MIYYIHKETGQIISKEKLMEYNTYKPYDKNEVKINFCKSSHKAFEHDITVFSYKVEEIPFSEDFEEIISLFSKGELYEMLSGLQIGMCNNENILRKIRKMIGEKHKLEMKGVFLDD